MSEMALRLIARAKREEWTELDLGNCGIVGEVPVEIGELEHLETLILGNEHKVINYEPWGVERYEEKPTGTPSSPFNPNRIWRLPDSFGNMNSLRELVLSGTDIQDLYPISKLWTLEYLDISNTRVSDLFPIRNAHRLLCLDVSSSLVEDITSLSGLNEIYNLDLGWNALHRPESLFQIRNLESLRANFEGIEPTWEHQFSSNIQHLVVEGIDSQNFSFVESAGWLLELKINGLEIGYLDFLSSLTNLKYLDVSSNEIRSIYPLRELETLSHLILRNNPITNLSVLKSLEGLTALDLSTTGIQTLKSLEGCSKLTDLNISNTPIKSIRSLEKLKRLRFLDVSNTQIKSIKSLSKCTQLTQLNLSNTGVSDLSPLSGNLFFEDIAFANSKVEYLRPLRNLIANGTHVISSLFPFISPIRFGNQVFKDVPEAIIANGREAVLAHWREQDRVGELPATDIKLFLLGNTTAGKSTLRHALIHQEYNEAISSTHGAELHEAWKDGDETLHLWDFGGQEYFHATHRLFLSSNSLYAVIADPNFNQGGYHKTLIKQFGETEPREEELEHFHHDYWLEMVQRAAPQGSVMMVWNKLDQEKTEKHSLTDGEKQRFENAGQIHEYFQSPKAALQAESPKWKAQWEALRQDILEAAKKLLKDQKVIRYWPQVREAIEERSKTDLWISWEEFVRICMDDDPLRELGNIIIYLRDMCGAILYWDVDGLRDQVFINPNKINQLIYAVLDRTVQQAQGRFTRSHAETQVAMALAQLHGADAQAQDIPATTETLLRVMRQFEIIFEVVAGTGEYVAPQYLSRVEPETVKAAKEFAGLKPSFFLRFRSYIPRHLVPMFIARKGLLAVGRNYWKHGIVFKEAGVNACLEVDYDGGTVQVSIENPDSNLAAQRLIFATIREISDLDTSMEVSTDATVFVRYTELLKAEGMGNPRCESLQGTPMEVSKMAVFLNRIPVALEIDPKPPIVKTHIHICFADGDRSAYNNLEKYLETFAGIFNFSYWSRANLLPGEVKLKRIEQGVGRADAIIFLTSIDLIAGKGDTKYDYDLCLQKVEAGNALAVPILISSVALLDRLPLGKYPFPAGVGAVDLESNPAKAWQEVIEWIFKVFEQRDQASSQHSSSSSDRDLLVEIANKVNAIQQGTDRMASKVDAIKEGNDRIEKKLDVEFNRIMNKLHDSMDFQNEVYQNLMMLGERIDTRVEDSQEQWAELHGQLETALNEAIGKLSTENAAKVDEILALLAPSEELSKGRKFLKSIKLKLPVIAVTVALLAGGAPVATAALVAALSRSIEYETTADGVFQRLIKLLRNPGAPMLPMGQS